MEKFRERQPRRFFNVLQIKLFFRNHELKAKKKFEEGRKNRKMMKKHKGPRPGPEPRD